MSKTYIQSTFKRTRAKMIIRNNDNSQINTFAQTLLHLTSRNQFKIIQTEMK